jgi:hypothetical protein
VLNLRCRFAGQSRIYEAVHPYVPAAACFIGRLLALTTLRTTSFGCRSGAGNVAALNEQADYVRLRRFFAEQILDAYLRIAGRVSKLGFFSSSRKSFHCRSLAVANC